MADKSVSKNNGQEKVLTPNERILEAVIKSMEKRYAEGATAKVESGEKPNNVVGSLIQNLYQGSSPDEIAKGVELLSQTQVPIAGSRKGILALGDLLQGQGFNPDAPRTTVRGDEDAIKILGNLVGIVKGQQDIEKAPMEMNKATIDVAKGLNELLKETPEGEERELQKTIKEKEMGAEATARGTKMGETSFAKEQLSDILDNIYFPVGDALPTAEGMGRFKNAASLAIQGFTGKGEMGALVQELDGLNNRLRVTLVRAAGDVGNINIMEQLAQQKLAFRLDDTPQFRELKKAVLKDLSSAYGAKESGKAKEVIKKFMNNPQFKEKYGKQFSEKSINDKQQKLNRANEIAKKNPNLSKQEILEMINSEFNNRR